MNLIITIISLIIIYKLYEQEKIKGAFIFRLAVAILSFIFIEGNDISLIFSEAKLVNNGVLFLIIYTVLDIIFLYILNWFEYYVAFRPYGHMIVVYIFVCLLMEFAVYFLFSFLSTFLALIFHVNLF